MYGVIGHHANECSNAEKKCYKCGKTGHFIADSMGNVVTFYNYGEQGHISTNCQKAKKAQSGGIFFAFLVIETTSVGMLI